MAGINSSSDETLILRQIDELHHDLDPVPGDMTDSVLFAFDLDLSHSSGLADSPGWDRYDEV